MVYRTINYVPGLYKIFDEIIVNAADNKVRDATMDTIKVSIDRENNSISVHNNGRGIPVEIHAKEGVYVPELIFGHLLTSSNYDDDEKKVTGGRNGYGAKLCNIFSTQFIVETADSQSGKKFKQVFSKNMSVKGEPKITPNPRGEDYTRITFKPDLAKFNLQAIDDDFDALLKKRVYDLAGCVRGIKVYLNDVRIKIKDFKDYVNLYLGHANAETGVKPPIVYERVSDRWEVAFTPSEGQFNQVSFVNSICTTKGGTHVNHVADQIVTNLVEAVKKKDKKGVPLKPFQAKNQMWVFVNCQIENPSFDSQTKENMTLRISAFGSRCAMSDDFFKKVMKTGVVENILSFAKFKQDQMLKKTDGHGKRSRISGITKLDDANNAGTRNASKCTLILTEGDSAKSLAVSGLSVVGRDNFGVFPLRGKLLNVREASSTQTIANAEISAIKQILGLQQGKVYQDASSLRYGHLMIMTDQDHDGSHIKGLIINLFDHFWPSLLKTPGFLLEFITPIVKASKGKGNNRQEVSFFTIPEYEEWRRENNGGHGWSVKYFKGLGTSTTQDAKQYFSDMDKHLKPFMPLTPEATQLIDMAFNKKKADDRKEWLRGFQPGTFMDHSVPEISITDFINRELILFSMADNARSIPSSVDGFKPGHRKILYACFKRNLRSEIKVAQLTGYVAEHSAYHHGEQSLSSTIVGMAQNFVGSNNLPLLEPIGQFGTRLQGGKDAASARYIFTNLSSLARAVFHPSDDPLLKYLVDDGQPIEPEWYLPVIPMLLVNGSDGIGTGWSSTIPNYDPRDVVEAIYCLMEDKDIPEMTPWYRGFTGRIEKDGADRYRVTGVIEKIDSTTVEITELPIRTWTQSYKEQLESWLQGTEKVQPWIKDYKEYHTDSSVHFVVTLSEQALKDAEKEGLEKKFKLTASISTSNLVCFDLEGRIKKYDSVESIIRDFYDLRLSYYRKRKEYMLDQMTFELTRLENKVRFVTEIIEGKLVVQNRKKVQILEELKSRDYTPIYKNKKNGSQPTTPTVTEINEEGEADDDEQGDKSDHGYDYLLTMPIWSLTWEKVQQLMKEMKAKEDDINALIGKTINDLWRTDLDAFLAQWDHFESCLKEMESHRPANGTTAMSRGKKGAASGKKALAAIAKKVKKAKGIASDEEEEEDSEDDFVKTVKPVKKASSSSGTGSKYKASSSSSSAPVKVPSKRPSPSKNTDIMDDGNEGKPPAKKRAMGAKKSSKPPTASEVSSKLVSKAAASKKKAVEISDNSESNNSSPVTKKVAVKAAAPKRAASKKKLYGSDQSEEEEYASVSDESDFVKSSPKKKSPTKQSENIASDDMDEEEEVKPAKKKVAKKVIAIDSATSSNRSSPVGKAKTSKSATKAAVVKPKAVSKPTTKKKKVVSESEEELSSEASVSDPESEADFDDESD